MPIKLFIWQLLIICTVQMAACAMVFIPANKKTGDCSHEKKIQIPQKKIQKIIQKNRKPNT